MELEAVREFVEGVKLLEQATAGEMECVAKLEPGDYEIYSEKLNQISLEAKEIMTRIGVTGMLHSGDLVVGIYTSKGDMVTGICGTYLHSLTAQIPIKFILKYWKDNPTVGIKEGDIFYCNDALYGGIHNHDQIAIMPIFYQGELIAWSASAVHQTEVGAIEPGVPVSARSRYHEGMRLIPIKIGENYQLKEDLLEMMANMVARAHRMQSIDVRARATACDRVRIRIQELADKKGVDFLRGLFRRMLMYSDEAARERIRHWNDGIYRHVVFLDTVGHHHGLLRICLTLHKEGDHLTFDFSGTSPEHDGPMQMFKHIVRAMGAVFFYSYPFSDFPVSSGIYNCMDFIVPPGTILNASTDASVAQSPILGTSIWSLLAVCFAKMMFDSDQISKIAAFTSGAGAGHSVAATNRWGVKSVYLLTYPLNAWGSGARVDMDGVDCHGFPFGPFAKGDDSEFAESEEPHLALLHNRLKDSCGFGKYRGGAGFTGVYILHYSPYGFYRTSDKEAKIQANCALFGGYPPPTHPGIEVTNTNIFDLLQSGDSDLFTDVYELVTQRKITGTYTFEHCNKQSRRLNTGDIFVARAPGGGGYGDVLERDPNLVMQDIRDNAISHWVAKNIYWVVFDPEALEVDWRRTEELRQAEREDRKRRGKPFDAFEKEWLRKKPKKSILKYYGSWPNAAKVKEVIRP